MKLRTTKKWCKRSLQEYNPPLEVICTVRRLFIVKPRRGFVCMRWYAFTVSAADNPRLPELLAEQQRA